MAALLVDISVPFAIPEANPKDVPLPLHMGYF